MAARRRRLLFGLVAFAASALFSSGCATTAAATATRVFVGDADRGRIGSTRTVVGLARPELAVNIRGSTAGRGGGLLGAVVDSAVNNSRAKDAEAAVVPVRNALIGYEPGQVLGAALGRELAALVWLKDNAVEVRRLEEAAAVAELQAGGGPDALLLVLLDYRLTEDFFLLLVSARAWILPGKALAPADPGVGPLERKPIYLNTFSCTRGVDGFRRGKTTLDEAAAVWAANGGEQARKILDENLAELAAMIAYDLAEGGPPGATSPTAPYELAKGEKPSLALGAFGQGVVSGRIARGGSGRCWVRAVTGELGATYGCYR